jgi:hypothetical protein
VLNDLTCFNIAFQPGPIFSDLIFLHHQFTQLKPTILDSHSNLRNFLTQLSAVLISPLPQLPLFLRKLNLSLNDSSINSKPKVKALQKVAQRFLNDLTAEGHFDPVENLHHKTQMVTKHLHLNFLLL